LEFLRHLAGEIKGLKARRVAMWVKPPHRIGHVYDLGIESYLFAVKKMEEFFGLREVMWRPYDPEGHHKGMCEQNRVSYFVVKHVPD